MRDEQDPEDQKSSTSSEGRLKGGKHGCFLATGLLVQYKVTSTVVTINVALFCATSIIETSQDLDGTTIPKLSQHHGGDHGGVSPYMCSLLCITLQIQLSRLGYSTMIYNDDAIILDKFGIVHN